jgi:hypothetical protein
MNLICNSQYFYHHGYSDCRKNEVGGTQLSDKEYLIGAVLIFKK